jgi:hypothetical protein
MKKFFFCLFFIGIFADAALAGPGDTITVQTFSFGSPQDAWFVFPSDTIRFEKILMQYTLKCNPAQSPACGEWDYLTYTYLYQHTGLLDSSVVHQPAYTLNGNAPDSILYMTTPSYTYSPSWQYYTVHTDTTSLNAYTIGAGMLTGNFPLGASHPVSRVQYLWRATEMTSAGLAPGNITGLQFYLQSLGTSLNHLTIRIKSTGLDSLDQSTFSPAGFTTVYSKNTGFASTGWNSLQLTTPFNWDGTSNLVIEITYDNAMPGTDNTVASANTGFASGLYQPGNDRVAAFHSYGFIDVPMNSSLTALDSFVTVAFWTYGTAAYQPMDGTCFEAVDASGNRILNAHLPWSDSNVYWDAGYNAGYDRINKAATTAETEGQWNFWAFTKNIATGSMKIYNNGALWHSGTGKTKPLNNIAHFRIGQGNWAGSQTYEGRMDDFMVFNQELSLAEVQDLMQNRITPSHPLYPSLVLDYDFNDGNYSTMQDNAPGTHATAVINGAGNPLKPSDELLTYFQKTNLRPNVTFEQGVFTSHTDSVAVVDSVMNAPQELLVYTDSVNHPGIAIDTMVVWPVYYNHYVYDASGHATDSAYVGPDAVIHNSHYDWYNKFPQVLRFELARYITPYGNGLSLGSGWTWTYDLSDYRTLLHDSVHLAAGNWQELLDVKFLMIEGTPPRDVLGIQNLWNGGFNYGNASDPIESHLTAKTVNIPTGALNTRWKSRVTGHGMDSPENCAEFCAKNHFYKVNGVQQFLQNVWRNTCDLNPLYPQGGTWVYDRANWCPGAEVATYDFELTPYAAAGATVTLDHDVQPYVNTGDWDYYQIEDQLITYGAPNFTLDAALEDIVSPSTNQMWLRYNPICDNPIVRIKNTGSTTLTSLTITYGLNGATPSVYHWTGSLAFMQSVNVTLDNFDWVAGASNFTVTISNPNGGSDQYSYNNSMTTAYTAPPAMPSAIVFEVRTNNNGSETNYQLRDAAGTVLLDRNSLSPNTLYRDTFNLANGCYEFVLNDTGEDGLSFWANPGQGSGYCRFRKVTPAGILKSFGADFGGQIYQQFTVGLVNNVNEVNPLTSRTEMFVYPNPSTGMVNIDVNLTERNNGTIGITNALGETVYNHRFTNVVAESVSVDLSAYRSGVYFVTLRTGQQVITKRLMKQ